MHRAEEVQADYVPLQGPSVASERPAPTGLLSSPWCMLTLMRVTVTHRPQTKHDAPLPAAEEFTVEADSYEEGVRQSNEQVPDGHLVLYRIVDRDAEPG